jgi:ABC-type glycerol-3-phosphate transport system permease component
MTVVGAKNFMDIFQNPRYSEAMPRVFVWTIVYAFSSVFLTFSVGVLVALLFNTPVMRGRKLYRSLLIIPYAIPGFLSILIWKGLLNDQWGTINTLLGLDVHWLTDPNIAKISILLVNTWLGFPYMFLVATGALQAIPAELKEAAAVDGANRFQSFRNVTLPLLMVAVGPLLVGSFSFNFNNFNQIYLLTGGGPALQNSKSAAGATDILISYTYKLAFASGKGNNYGLSAAVSILIFFIVGALSFWSFRRSKALENMA